MQGLLSMFIVQLQVLLGYSSFLAGMVYLPMILLALPVTLAMHKLPKGIDARLPACLNLLGFAVTFYWIGLFDDRRLIRANFLADVAARIFSRFFFHATD